MLCIVCRYNLRGLAQTSTCPECGLAVERSLWNGNLNMSDRRWVRRLSRAMMGLLIGVLLIPSALLASVSTVVMYGNWYSPRWWVMFCAISPIAVILVSLWFLTSPEPGARGFVSYDKVRRRLRVVAVTCAGCSHCY